MIDLERFECRLPDDKVQELRFLVHHAKGILKLRLQEVQSLLGKRNFACRIILMGWVFCPRLSIATAGVSSPFHFARLSPAPWEDLAVWTQFLDFFNGRSLFLEGPLSSHDMELYTDASGAFGFAAYLQGYWCAGCWSQDWVAKVFRRNFALLEEFPIVVAVEIWGDWFQDKKVCFLGDNLGVVNSPPPPCGFVTEAHGC